MKKRTIYWAVFQSRNGLRILAVTTLKGRTYYGRDENGKTSRRQGIDFIRAFATEAEAVDKVIASQAAERQHREAWQRAIEDEYKARQARLVAEQTMLNAAYAVFEESTQCG